MISAARFPDTALINLSPEDEALVKAVQAELQAELAALSPKGKHITAEGSAHYIQISQPQLVIDAIREVVKAVRGGG